MLVGGANAAAVPRKDARISDEVFMVELAFRVGTIQTCTLFHECFMAPLIELAGSWS